MFWLLLILETCSNKIKIYGLDYLIIRILNVNELIITIIAKKNTVNLFILKSYYDDKQNLHLQYSQLCKKKKENLSLFIISVLKRESTVNNLEMEREI